MIASESRIRPRINLARGGALLPSYRRRKWRCFTHTSHRSFCKRPLECPTPFSSRATGLTTATLSVVGIAFV